MDVKTILVLLVLNIALPTLDTFIHINLVYKLYRGAHYCRCPIIINIPSNYSTCHYSNDNWYDYKKCLEDPASYCSNDKNNHNVCVLSTHPHMAATMLTPFLLNYIVCFITFLRKEKNKKFTFIFALLNIYPQFGKNNH